MRILDVVHFFSPLHGGGSINVVYDFSKRLTERGHEVTIYTSDFGLDQEFIKSLKNVNVHVFRSFLVFANIYVTLGMIVRLKRIRDFDLIHIHCYRSFQSLLIYFFARLYSVPYFVQAHGGLPVFKKKRRLSWIYDSLFGDRLLQGAYRVIALTQIEAQQYEAMGVPKDKIVILSNGIDLSQYYNLPLKGSFRNKYNIRDNAKVILYLGRINQIKGVDILVRAFENIVEKLDDVKLVIVGPDDGYLRQLKVLIKSLRIEDKVLIIGPLYGEDKLEAYVDADVYALPSKYEAFPMTVLEAMACGTPIVLSENCSISEVVRDKTGLIANPSPTDLGKALLKILTDEKLQRQYAENSKWTIRQFDLNRTVSKLEKVYQELL